MYIPKALFVRGDAAATANNIAAHESLFRWGIVTYLIASVLFIFVTLAFYRLFKEVDHGLAVQVVILGSLMPVPIFFINSVTDAAALLLVRGADFLSVVDKLQRDSFAMMFLNLHHHLDLANAIFWGLWLLPLLGRRWDVAKRVPVLLVCMSDGVPRAHGIAAIANGCRRPNMCRAGYQ